MEDQPTGIKNRGQIECSLCGKIFVGAVPGPLPGTIYIPGVGMVETSDAATQIAYENDRRGLLCERCFHSESGTAAARESENGK